MKGKVFTYRKGPSDAEMNKGYKKQADSYAKAGDSSSVKKLTIYPAKKKRRM